MISVMWKSGVMAAENSALSSKAYMPFYKNRIIFLNVTNISQYYCFTAKYSLYENNA